jgi:hypothetical protein
MRLRWIWYDTRAWASVLVLVLYSLASKQRGAWHDCCLSAILLTPKH